MLNTVVKTVFKGKKVYKPIKVMVFFCLFLVLDNLEQTTVSNFGPLESQPDFRTPEFVSTATLILNLSWLA